jgi:hypothetical protein
MWYWIDESGGQGSISCPPPAPPAAPLRLPTTLQNRVLAACRAEPAPQRKRSPGPFSCVRSLRDCATILLCRSGVGLLTGDRVAIVSVRRLAAPPGGVGRRASRGKAEVQLGWGRGGRASLHPLVCARKAGPRFGVPPRRSP